MKCAICKRKIDEKYVGVIYRIHGKVICQDCARAIYSASENKLIAEKLEKEEQHTEDANQNSEMVDKHKLKKSEDIV